MASRYNPAVSPEQYRLAQAVLSGTARESHMPVKVAREIVEKTPARLKSEWSRNPSYDSDIIQAFHDWQSNKAYWKSPNFWLKGDFESDDPKLQRKHIAPWNKKIRNTFFTYVGFIKAQREYLGLPPYKSLDNENPSYGMDLDLETSMAPAWVYYDSKKARDVAARLYEGQGKKVVKESSFFGYRQAGGKKYRLRAADHRGNPSRLLDPDKTDDSPENVRKIVKLVQSTKSLKTLYEAWVWAGQWNSGGDVWPTSDHSKPGIIGMISGRLAKSGKTFDDLLRFERKHNPEGASEEMFESFHGEPSDETVEYVEEEHYHGNLAALGEMVELKVKLVNGGKAIIGFEAGGGEQADNPFWPFNSFTKTTIYHVGTGEKYKKSGSFKGYTLYQKLDTGELLVPALDKDSRFDTLKDAKAFIDSWTKHQKNPAPLDEHAAKELELYVENDADLYRQQYMPINKNLITRMARGVYNHMLAVKQFGYLMESGAKKYAKEYSEGKDWHQIFSPATRKHVAELFTNHFETEAKLGNYDSLLPKKYQKKNPKGRRGHSGRGGPFREAGKLVGSITSGASRPMDDFIGAAGKVGGYLDDQIGRALNPDHNDTGPTRLCSNEAGTQLLFIGGDQSLDLNGLGITGSEAEKELVYIGHVTHITYHTRKQFGKKPEEFDYVHRMGEDGGKEPILNYDRINKRLLLSGGTYKIERPLMGTSAGIER